MRNIIEITNHPLISVITRKAQVRLTENNYENKTATMVVNVFHYIDDAEVKDMFKQVSVIATNTPINPLTFEYVEEGTEGSAGEFDTLYALLENKIKNQFELEEMFIQLRITSIDKKLYNL